MKEEVKQSHRISLQHLRNALRQLQREMLVRSDHYLKRCIEQLKLLITRIEGEKHDV